MKKKIPKEILEWAKSHCGSKVPSHAEGMFEKYSNSTCSACWGSPIGGITVGKYKVAVYQPSPLKRGDTPQFFYDYKLIT